jgi:hypothetical protein
MPSKVLAPHERGGGRGLSNEHRLMSSIAMHVCNTRNGVFSEPLFHVVARPSVRATPFGKPPIFRCMHIRKNFGSLHQDVSMRPDHRRTSWTTKPSN